MKKYLVMILVFVMCISLCACFACEHEWTVADCVNGAVCSKCGEADEPALGHDWDMATCEKPKTCARCGETEGEPLDHSGGAEATCENPQLCHRCDQILQEPLGHSFGEWEVTETDRNHRMRTCITCGLTETEEIDEETYWLTTMQGLWSFYLSQKPGSLSFYTNDDYGPEALPPYAVIEDSNIKVYSDGECVYDATLKYTGFVDETACAWFGVCSGDEYLCNLVYTTKSEQEIDDYILLAFSNVWLNLDNCKNQKEIVATQWWMYAEDGNTYTIDLNEDGTFTANWGEEISGSWMGTPAKFAYEGQDDGHGYTQDGFSGDCRLVYEKDGETVILKGDIRYRVKKQDGEYDWGADINSATLYLTLDEEAGEVPFHALNHPLESLERVQKAKSQMVGNWRSVAIDSGEGRSTNTDYSMTFKADGTFTMQQDEELTGTWTYDGIRLDSVSGDAYENEYEYNVKYVMNDRSYWTTIPFDISTGELTFFYFGDKIIYFVKEE